MIYVESKTTCCPLYAEGVHSKAQGREAPPLGHEYSSEFTPKALYSLLSSQNGAKRHSCETPLGFVLMVGVRLPGCGRHGDRS